MVTSMGMGASPIIPALAESEGAKPERSGVHSQPWVHREFEARLIHIRFVS